MNYGVCKNLQKWEENIVKKEILRRANGQCYTSTYITVSMRGTECNFYFLDIRNESIF